MYEPVDTPTDGPSAEPPLGDAPDVDESTGLQASGVAPDAHAPRLLALRGEVSHHMLGSLTRAHRMATDYYRDYAELRGWDGVESASQAEFFDALASKAGVSSRARILEIGFGNGDFLRWALARGHDIFGYEIQSLLVERARAAGINAAAGPIDSRKHEQPIDVIVALDVLEHLTIAQIEDVLNDGKRLLRGGGFFIFRFPNAASPFGAIYQGSDVTHVTPLSLGSLTQITRACGLSEPVVVRLRTYPRSLLAKAKRFAAYALQDALESAISLAYEGGKSGSLSPNCLVTVRRGP